MTRRAALIAVLILSMVLPASAHVRTVLDSDDSPGPLDIVAARLRHEDRMLRLHVRTYEPWSNETLEDRKNYVGFQFNLDRDERIERCVIVKLNPPESEGPTVIEGGVYTDDCLTELYNHPGNVLRYQPNGLTVVLPTRRIGTLQFRWRAVTSFEGPQGDPNCPEDIGPEPRYGSCTDFTSWNRHRRSSD